MNQATTKVWRRWEFTGEIFGIALVPCQSVRYLVIGIWQREGDVQWDEILEKQSNYKGGEM